MGQFKVVTYNLENLFPVGSQSGPDTAEEFEEKTDCLASVILGIDADVVGVQEVGDEGSFQELIGKLGGRYPHSQLSANPDRRGIRVGFLSKLPIDESEDHSAFPEGGLTPVRGSIGTDGVANDISSFGRGPLRIRVTPDGAFPVDLVVVHFKSKLLTFPGDFPFRQPRDENERAKVAGAALIKRTGEAVATRSIANSLIEGSSDSGLIVLGDFNDVTDAATTQILRGDGGSEIGTRGFDLPDQNDDDRLWNIAPLIPEERRFSRINRGVGELIDHIFASFEFFPDLGNGNGRRLPTADSHVDALGHDLPSVTDDPRERRRKPG